jgi:hypothetical protein
VEQLLAQFVAASPVGVVIAVLAAPWLALATGRLQPRQNVADWRDAYFKSEDARATERDTTARLLTYAEAADHLLRTALGPGLPPAPREGGDDGAAT